MILKSIDHSLMAEHLTTHLGAIRKLKVYYCTVKHPYLKNIVGKQLAAMQSHVKVMLSFIEPTQQSFIPVPSLSQLQQPFVACQSTFGSLDDQAIAIEAETTATSMSKNNYLSALRMKVKPVREAHFKMANQQAHFQEQYREFISGMGWSYAPKAAVEEQQKTVNHFLKLFEGELY